MAAPKENLLSLGQLTGKEGNTFMKQRRHGLKNCVNRPQLLQADFSTPQTHQQLRAMHLQQHWQELKERELTAQQHNRQLLQQFEEAQGTLREMLALTAAMKTIRMEYEQFLEDNSPRWQQQLKEKTAAAQKKRMEEYLKSCPKNTAARGTSSTDGPLLSQGSSTMAQTIAAPPKHYSPNSHLDYNQHGSPHLPYMQSSWLNHQQSHIARFPIRAPYQPQGSSPVPPSFLPPNTFPYAHSLPLQHLTSTTADHHPRLRHNPPGWASLQPDYPWSWAPGPTGISSDSEALWGQLYMEEPPLEMGLAQVEADTSRAQSSKRERGNGGGGSHLSQELDIKPVRLSGGLAESRGSSRESSQGSRVKRKKREERGRSHCSSSDRESCSSLESSRCSNAIAAVTVAQSSKSDASSEKSRSVNSGRTGGLAVGLSRAEKVGKESKGDDPGSHKEESHSTSEEVKSFIEESGSEEAENHSPDDKSESLGEQSGAEREEESGRVSVKTGKVESSRSEQSSVGEKDEDDLGDNGCTEEKEKHQTDEEQEESHIKGDDEPSVRKNTTDEEETGADDEAMEQESEVKGDREEQSDRLKNEDGENGKKDSSSSKEEEEVDESEGDESDEEEQRGDLAGEPDEERDSDSIISPQDRSKTMHIIPKDTSEEDEENKSEGDEDNVEEEESDGLKSEDGENGNKGSSSSQEEEEADESEGDEDNVEDEESDEEEQRGDLDGQPDEEGDSDDGIISPQDRSKRMHIIPEEATEDVEESKRGSSGDDSQFSDEDDAEHLLALHQQSQKKEVKDLKAAEKPKAICDNVEIFQVETDQSTKSDHPSDSDEFDNFYG